MSKYSIAHDSLHVSNPTIQSTEQCAAMRNILVEVEGKEVKRGNSLFHDVAEFQSGRLIPDDLPIDIFQYVDLDFSVEHPHRWRQRHRRVTSILGLGYAIWICREVT